MAKTAGQIVFGIPESNLGRTGLAIATEHRAGGLGARNLLRSFRVVHKDVLSDYVAICEHSVNLKRITPQSIAALVYCKWFRDEPNMQINEFPTFVEGGGYAQFVRVH